MNIEKQLDSIPSDVKNAILDLMNVPIMHHGKVKESIKVVCDCVLSNDTIERLKDNNKLIGVGSIAIYRNAPSIKHSYFYVV